MPKRAGCERISLFKWAALGSIVFLIWSYSCLVSAVHPSALNAPGDQVEHEHEMRSLPDREREILDQRSGPQLPAQIADRKAMPHDELKAELMDVLNDKPRSESASSESQDAPSGAESLPPETETEAGSNPEQSHWPLCRNYTGGLEGMMSWLEESGADIGSVTPKTFDVAVPDPVRPGQKMWIQRRGLAATRNLKKGEALLRIPFKNMLRTESMEDTPFQDMAEALRRAGVDDKHILAVFLMWSLHQTDYNSAPFWTKAELMAKDEEYPGILERAEKALDKVRVAHETMSAVSSSALLKLDSESVLSGDFPDEWNAMDQLPLKDMQLAYLGMINTRTWGDTIDSVTSKTMVPFGDLVNHKPRAGYAEIEDRDKVLYTSRPVHKDNEVFISYGHKCNRDLLRLYGFELKDNPYICSKSESRKKKQRNR